MFLALCPVLACPVMLGGGLAGGMAALAGEAAAQTPQQKVIQGRVLGDGDAPQPGAVVYLKSAKSNIIKSYLAAADGTYRFGQLATDTDYTLWAELHGKKSPVKTITAYDNKRQFVIDLHLTDKAK